MGSVQVLDLLEEFEGAGCEFLGGWVGGEIDSVGAAVVAGLGWRHVCGLWDFLGVRRCEALS